MAYHPQKYHFSALKAVVVSIFEGLLVEHTSYEACQKSDFMGGNE
jgi:hypothetical protein